MESVPCASWRKNMGKRDGLPCGIRAASLRGEHPILDVLRVVDVK